MVIATQETLIIDRDWIPDLVGEASASLQAARRGFDATPASPLVVWSEELTQTLARHEGFRDSALKARKTKTGWELVLDDDGRFQAKIGANARALATEFSATAPLREHLSVDIQPSGDKKSTTLWLEVWFDTRLARCKIEVPEAAAGGDGK